MKLRFSRQHGGTLLITLSLSIVLGTALASYLKLVEYQNRAVVRSQFWNAAIPAAEAGIEEALAHLNYLGDADRASNGWTQQDGKYKMSRNLGGARYEVSVDSASQPTITSMGYVTEPLTKTELKRTVLVQTTRVSAGMRGIVARRSITMNGNTRIDSFDSENSAYSTNGRYDSTKAHDAGYAAAVAGDVYAEGEGVYGYVASGPNGTATGNVGDKTWLASHSGIQSGHYAKDLNLAFPDVTAPYNGGAAPLNDQTVTTTNYTYLTSQTTSLVYPDPVPPSGVVTQWQTFTSTTKPFSYSGTLTTNTAATSSTTYPAAGSYIGNVVTRTVITGSGKKATTTIFYDYAAITGYTYTTQTYTYNTTTTNSTTQTSTYTYVTDSGNYQMNALSMSGHSEMLVRGNTVLYLPGDFSMSGQSQITILPGASLKIYVAGNASLSGNGVMNLNQDASKYSIYGLPTCTSISLSGNAAFTGTIYAPAADLSLNGGGNNVYDCVGAVVVNNAYFHGHFNFHYDERLGRNGGKSQFRVAFWTEI
jgi:hypothetical protein